MTPAPGMGMECGEQEASSSKPKGGRRRGLGEPEQDWDRHGAGTMQPPLWDLAH